MSPSRQDAAKNKDAKSENKVVPRYLDHLNKEKNLEEEVKNELNAKK